MSVITEPGVGQPAEQSSDTLLVRLVMSCPDQPGIVAAVSRFLFTSGANIVRSDQYSTDPSGGTFFLRMEFTLRAGGETISQSDSDCRSPNHSE